MPELWRLRRDAPGGPNIILENIFLNAKYLYPRLVAKGIDYISENPGYIDQISTGGRTTRRPLPNKQIWLQWG